MTTQPKHAVMQWFSNRMNLHEEFTAKTWRVQLTRWNSRTASEHCTHMMRGCDLYVGDHVCQARAAYTSSRVRSPLQPVPPLRIRSRPDTEGLFGVPHETEPDSPHAEIVSLVACTCLRASPPACKSASAARLWRNGRIDLLCRAWLAGCCCFSLDDDISV
jgi:hypothetical protein